METPTKNQLGGTAAETTNFNSNPNPNPDNMKKQKLNQEAAEESVMLKHAAAKFGCAASSLRNNIKGGKLQATQENPTSAYMVRLSDVESFLRSTPGVVSVFHSKTGEVPVAETGQPTCASAVDHGPASADMVSLGNSAEMVGDLGKPSIRAVDASVENSNSKQFTSPLAQQSAKQQTNGKKRRHRRRGKGGRGADQPNSLGAHPLLLKSLAGASPEERLRLNACLNELASLIATV